MKRVPFLLLIVLCVFIAGCGPSAGGSYTVTGRITKADDPGQGLEGVTIAFSGGYGTATTDAGGNWSMTGLKGTVTVTPAKTDWAFNPASRQVTKAANDIDFIASSSFYTVSGRVTCQDTGQTLEGVTVSFSGGYGAVDTGPDGTWSKGGLKGAVTVTPTKDGWIFNPSSTPVSGAASGVDFAALRVFPIVFDDPRLDAEVRWRIGKPTGQLMNTDVMHITELRISSRDIARLGGMEHLINLRELRMYDNWISDISPLLGLTNITLIDLSGNRISDTSPLSGLTNIQVLDLGQNRISDISPLSSLTNTQILDLGQNWISDISPLSGLTNLEVLVLDENRFDDIGALAGLTRLRRLDLYKSQISDISALAGLTEMRYLELAQNQISDISALAGLTKLKKLYLRVNQILDIGSLAELADIEVLQLGYNQISDIGALAGLTSITSLSLYGNQISDISPLAALTNIQSLNLSENQISDIDALAGLTGIQSFFLSHNRISDISALVANPGLDGGDDVYVEYNYLDVSPGSDDMQSIDTLNRRGVAVYYRPQR